MFIQKGLIHKKILGIKRKVIAEDFHATFGSTLKPLEDFDLNPHLHPSFDQNNPNTLFQTPAQPEGCTGMADASVGESVYKIPLSPYYCYQHVCLAQGVPIGSACELPYALNEPVISGLQGLEESEAQALQRKMPPWWEVKPLNGSLFKGILSALSIGGASVSFAGTWYESYEQPVNGIVPVGEGESTGHNWVFSGQKTIGGVPYLIAESFLGANWGEGGFCFFSEAEVNANRGQAFTPKESPNANIPAPVTLATIRESLLNFLKALFNLQSNNVPILIPMQSPTTVTTTNPTVSPVQAPTSPATTFFLWDTPAHCYHNTRVLCDQMGLTIDQKNLICACIYQESEFVSQAKHENLNKDGTISSTDWGICQINDYFHIAPTGTPFASIEQVLSDPAASVKYMIQCYKNGQLYMWSSYKTGAYRQWLSATSPMWVL